MMLPEIHTFVDLLNWLVGPGALVLAGFFVAYVLERFDFWQKWNHDLKSLIVVVFAVGISFAAQQLLGTPIIADNDFLNQMVALFVYYLGNQVAYKKYVAKELQT